ncbi:MAG: YheC/YheD family protein, partial [Bacillota bacterium]|nr:YheC/YheD family protein [Bacillota bacterium]
MIFNIIKDKKSSNKITVADTVIKKNKLTEIRRITLKFGCIKTDVEICEMDIDENTIWVSRDIIELLSIPTDLEYQINFTRDEVCIGPTVGLLLYQDIEYYTPNRLEKFFDYTLGYNEIKGLLCLIGESGLDFDKKTAEGYYYKASAKGKERQWVKGKFPIPDAVFRRAGLLPDNMTKLSELTENRVFNSYFFDKLEFWNICRSNERTKDYIPQTSKLKSFRDVERMLRRFDTIFLKPVNGTLGNGLLKIQKRGDVYTAQTKYEEKPMEFNDLTAAKEYIMDFVEGYSFIVQQDVNLIKYEDGYVDFRVILQKDYTKNWVCAGIVSCIGAKNGIHSNYIDEGLYLSFEEIMKRTFSLSNPKIFEKRMEIVNVCKNIGAALDETGENYGDLGIDVGFDKQMKPWVFEANKAQFFYVPLMIGDFNAYYSARTNPIRYAAALG